MAVSRLLLCLAPPITPVVHSEAIKSDTAEHRQLSVFPAFVCSLGSDRAGLQLAKFAQLLGA